MMVFDVSSSSIEIYVLAIFNMLQFSFLFANIYYAYTVYYIYILTSTQCFKCRHGGMNQPKSSQSHRIHHDNFT
jgi:hypothetical protein